MKENHTEDSDQNVKSHEERKYQGADPPTGERKDA